MKRIVTLLFSELYVSFFEFFEVVNKAKHCTEKSLHVHITISYIKEQNSHRNYSAVDASVTLH